MAESCLREVVAVLGAESATLFFLEDGELRSLLPGAGRQLRGRGRRCARSPRRRRRRPPGRRRAACLDGSGAAGDGGIYVPVRSPSGVSGVLTVQARRDGRAYSAGDARLVTSLSNLVGAFLDRERLQAAATTAAAEREGDRLKSSLLSSVSHELKTPLAALTATVSNLLESDVDWDEQSVRDELRAIVGDVARLNNSIGALLELSRLESDAWEPRRELYELGDVVAAGIDTLPAHLRDRVRMDLPDESPIVDVDFLQMTSALQNLLENALLYAGGTRTPVTAAPAAGTKARACGSRTKDRAYPPTNTRRCSRSSTADGIAADGRSPARAWASRSPARSCAATAGRSAWKT